MAHDGLPMTQRLKAGNKFGAKKTTVDGITFDSIAESKRYGELKLLQRAGKIRHLACQVKFGLYAGNDRRPLIGCYVADFAYDEGGVFRVEDVKGCDTALSAWKRKHLKLQDGIDVQIVRMK